MLSTATQALAASTINAIVTPVTGSVSSSSPASTVSPSAFGPGSLSAKSISDAIMGFANKFAVIGAAALVLGLGCAFVVYRRVNYEDED